MTSAEAIREAARRGGMDINDEQLAILSKRAEDVSEKEMARLSGLGSICSKGLFDAATDGQAFVDEAEIKARFGKGLADNYPEAGPEFLRFATTYWTVKILHAKEPDTLAGVMLGQFEEQCAALFFPTPGPVKVGAQEREAAQRQVLAAYAPRLDVEAFIAANPILMRDRAGVGPTGSTGCALVLIAGATALVSAAVLITYH